MYIIYKYTNKFNGKVYIGQTKNTMEQRALANGSNYKGCRRFYNAIQKYTWDAFIPHIIDSANTAEEANLLEQKYITEYKSTDPNFGYNISLGGDNKTMSEETIALISKKAKERYLDKTANPMYGKHHSQQTLAKQSEAKIGAKNPMAGSAWTEKQRQNSGTKGKKLNISDDQRQKLRVRAMQLGKTVGLRSVKCIEDNLVFASIQEAASTYGVSKSTLCGHLRGNQHTCKGKHFEYVN